MGWAWLILLLTTFPWLLAADLASDLTAGAGLIVFISGACIVAPCRRLRRWQSVPFAASVGFLFEARRPIPDGALALFLAAAAIFLTSDKQLIRNTPRMLRAAAACNAAACLIWFTFSAGSAGQLSGLKLFSFIPQLIIPVSMAGVAGVIIYIPVSLVQNAAMDRIGIPPASEGPESP